MYKSGLKEMNSLLNYLEHYLESIPNLSLPRNEFRNNKLVNLKIAQLVGFKIPETILTTVKKSLINFFEEHRFIITKGIHFCVGVTNGKSL
jgi:hypothetical protein